MPFWIAALATALMWALPGQIILVEMAAAKLGVAADQLVVDNGVVSVKGTPGKKTTYGELIGGKHFNVQLCKN